MRIERLGTAVVANGFFHAPRPRQRIRQSGQQDGIAGAPANRIGTRVERLAGVTQRRIAGALRLREMVVRGHDFRGGDADQERDRHRARRREHPHGARSLTRRMPALLVR